MRVLKFGGTSVGDPRRVHEAARITLNRPGDKLMVVSACGGVTNLLLEAGAAAAQHDLSARTTAVAEIHTRHERILGAIGDDALQRAARVIVADLHGSMDRTLTEIAEAASLSPRLSDQLVSHGEKIMATMMAHTLRAMGTPTEAVFTDTVLATDGRHGAARPNRSQTRDRAQVIIRPLIDAGSLVVATGFIGMGPDGATTTLGRGGSDYSATLLGAALDADEVEIWTDVPGILSADPRKVASARVIPEISYDEAQELAHFGAKVLHPRTIRPAVAQGIPVRILSTFQPTNTGTVVRETAPSHRIKATTALKGLTLLTLDVPELEDLASAASVAFRVVHEERVELLAVSQASSRRRMTLILDAPDHGSEAIVRRLETALRDDDIDVTLGCEDHVAVVAAVGEGAANTPASLAQLLAVLARSDVTVLNASQLSSNAAMVVVVPEESADRAVTIVHDSLIGTARTSRRITSRSRSSFLAEPVRVG